MFYQYIILTIILKSIPHFVKTDSSHEQDVSLETINPLDRKPINDDPVPKYFDWRDFNMVSPIKDQFNCTACWAFSAVANVESHLKIYLGEEINLSEQFLIDCDKEGNGCGNASVLKTFANIVTTFGGLLRETDYHPYSSRREPCRWERKNSSNTSKLENVISHTYPIIIPVIGFRRVYPDENVIAEFVYKYGPLSAGINSASMTVYNGGIDEPTDSNCDPNELNHAVLIVGYNIYVSRETGRRVPYWIIKNSWGPGWGEAGYYYLVRGRNACGITSDVSFAYVS